MKSFLSRPVTLFSLFLMLVAPTRGEAGEVLKTAGDAIAVLLPVAAGGATLYLDDSRGSVELLESAALAIGTTLVLKYAVDERRPDGNDHSFPSGHAAVSFSASEFIRKRYGWDWGLPAYAAASFVGYTRVEEKQHYIHDVLAGALIGIGSSYLFTDRYGNLAVAGEAGSGYGGVRLSGRW